MQSRIQKGIVAGVAATAAVAVLELVNILVVKWFAPFPLIVSNIVGLGRNMAAGWAIHIAFGVFILGPLFGMMLNRLPTDTPETKGIVFSVGAFVVMILAFMLLGSDGVFGRNFATIGWMLITNVVFGIVLGNVYARLEQRDRLMHPVGVAPAH